jgi:hypothetical protein
VNNDGVISGYRRLQVNERSGFRFTIFLGIFDHAHGEGGAASTGFQSVLKGIGIDGDGGAEIHLAEFDGVNQIVETYSWDRSRRRTK